MEFDLNKRLTNKLLSQFAGELLRITDRMDFKQSARGWCYTLEVERLLNKDQFDRAESVINRCIKRGFLPADFVAAGGERIFEGVEKPDENTPEQYMKHLVSASLKAEEYYRLDWWKGEKYYVQMLVEKVDLKGLFRPVCEKFHIPIANSKGWSSVIQRATYARRFREAEERGLKCVLLYCGDHDPDGMRISEFLRKNLEQVSSVRWRDGKGGYDPENLIIERFGLNFDFIKKNKLSWIDNLITGRKDPITKMKRDLSDKSHHNHQYPYVQDYLKKYGARKCEANALVVIPKEARQLAEDAILNYLGPYAEKRFERRRQEIRDRLQEFRERTGLDVALNRALEIIEEQEDE